MKSTGRLKAEARLKRLAKEASPKQKGDAKDYWRHTPCYVLVFKGTQATVIPCDDVNDAKIVRNQLRNESTKCWIVGRYIEVGEAERDGN